MGLLSVMFALVGVGALVIAAKALTQLGHANQAMMCLLADNLASSQVDQRDTMAAVLADQRATRATLSASHTAAQEHLLAALARMQGSISYSVADAVERVSTAVGKAVQTAATPVVAPLSIGEQAERIARDYVNADYQQLDVIDDTDPTDRWIEPERRDAALVGPADHNPTGIPGFGFDTPASAALPFDIPNPLIPNGAQ